MIDFHSLSSRGSHCVSIKKDKDKALHRQCPASSFFYFNNYLLFLFRVSKTPLKEQKGHVLVQFRSLVQHQD